MNKKREAEPFSFSRFSRSQAEPGNAVPEALPPILKEKTKKNQE